MNTQSRARPNSAANRGIQSAMKLVGPAFDRAFMRTVSTRTPDPDSQMTAKRLDTGGRPWTLVESRPPWGPYTVDVPGRGWTLVDDR
jgi:hypothetical protein